MSILTLKAVLSVSSISPAVSHNISHNISRSLSTTISATSTIPTPSSIASSRVQYQKDLSKLRIIYASEEKARVEARVSTLEEELAARKIARVKRQKIKLIRQKEGKEKHETYVSIALEKREERRLLKGEKQKLWKNEIDMGKVS